MPVSISKLVTPDVIDLELASTCFETVVRQLGRLLEKHPAVGDCEIFLNEVLAREKINTTALGNGVAFPHARTDAVNRIVVAAGRTFEGIQLGDVGPPVRLFFLIGTPKAMVADYLALVSRLVRRIRSDGLPGKLLAAGSPEEFVSLVALE
jgi:mannitol/fructose-specific phosphotransferase system IIA component (Ntr-type)